MLNNKNDKNENERKKNSTTILNTGVYWLLATYIKKNKICSGAIEKKN